MSISVSPRPLSLIPFFAADAVLLFTAGLVAWRTPDALTGGALLAVVFCTGLGALLALLPFVLNDAHAREAALAERQRELVALVTTSTDNASRWGSQWAAAAIGLEDAATLASRSIAAAERLPAVFQEKTEALSRRLEKAEQEAQARAEKTALQESALAVRMDGIGAASEGLRQTLAGFGGVAAELNGRHAAIAGLLAEFPAAAEQARTARVEFEERIATAPVQLEAQVGRLAAEAEMRLAASTDLLTARMARVEAAMEVLLAQCQRAVDRVSEAAPVAPAVLAVAVGPEQEPAVVAEEPSVIVSTVVAVEPEEVAASGVVKSPARSEIIMDPFLIPDDGYAALAEAMDAVGA